MNMVESVAKSSILYRGFVIRLNVTKRSSGERSVHTHINYHVPEIKPKSAERFDKRKSIETTEGGIECMRTYDTIGPVESDRLTTSEYYNPRHDTDESGIIPSWIPIFGGKSDNSPPLLSHMVRNVLQGTQENIDDYIANHAVVDIDPNEIRHGIEQAISEPMNGVEVSTPEMNSDSEYDEIRPEPHRIAEKLTE